MLKYEDLKGSNKKYIMKFYQYEPPYKKAQKINWNNLYQFTDKEINKQVIHYLNKFRCRIKITPTLPEKIRKAHIKTIPYLDSLRNEKLWEIKLNDIIRIYNQKTTYTDAIQTIFETFSNIGERFKHVATSKLLHQINPDIFMMWDNAIINSLNIGKKSADYVYTYLPTIKGQLCQLINEISHNEEISRKEAIDKINKIQLGKTPLKIIDEYYWIKTRK